MGPKEVVSLLCRSSRRERLDDEGSKWIGVDYLRWDGKQRNPLGSYM